jgi:hypothetical protein
MCRGRRVSSSSRRAGSSGAREAALDLLCQPEYVGVAVRDRDAMASAVVLEVDHAPVREDVDRELGDPLQRRGEVRRGVQQRRHVGQQIQTPVGGLRGGARLALGVACGRDRLLDAALLSDVGADPHQPDVTAGRGVRHDVAANPDLRAVAAQHAVFVLVRTDPAGSTRVRALQGGGQVVGMNPFGVVGHRSRPVRRSHAEQLLVGVVPEDLAGADVVLERAHPACPQSQRVTPSHGRLVHGRHASPRS